MDRVHHIYVVMKAGVQQGSVLRPLLFCIYINVIILVKKSSQFRLFANDTILYLFVDNPVRNAELLKRNYLKK